ncbi:Brp/Blh family beta-carotene 15,15'-dioxygenase [uncultured Dokdonia sp.]|uniref:Brp/Blh family beta-carotene 15,15'-dioxygenase n=1 Tax=uncultured Dokdonia sp. TaxID=575653 RepID=UPI002628A8BD|nr:Brp/Blh family beta-carotene 15,15'-dioxygenase [uncultured Dokdonia sp.]
MKNYKIVITFFLLWLTIQFDSEAENVLAYVSILTLGLLHGANDIKLLTRRGSTGTTSSYKILVTYVAFVLCVGVLFYILPVLALFVFVVISGFHFGEEHLHDKFTMGTRLLTYFFTTYGMLILFLIFYFNAEATSTIIYEITSYDLPDSFFLIGIGLLGISTLIFSLVVYKNKNKEVSYIEEFVYILVFIALFKMANLLWSFAIYFVIWHAIPSLSGQIRFLYGNTSFASVVKYLKSSFVYWLLSITGVFSLYFYLRDDLYLFNAIFFAFLATITFPHVWVINSMKSKK